MKTTQKITHEAYMSVETGVLGALNWFHHSLGKQSSLYGISGFKKTATQDGTEVKITDAEGRNILRILHKSSSALLETSTFKAFVEFGQQGKQVVLSEATGETLYTPGGKLIIKQGKMSKLPKLFGSDEYYVVADKIQNAIMEATPCISSHIPLQKKSLVTGSVAVKKQGHRLH